MKRLTLYAKRFRDDTGDLGAYEPVEPIAVSSSRSNHRRKAATRV
jgi:hypothetical protein